MNLPFLPKSAPVVSRKYLFALEISPQTVKSAVWSVINDKTQVLAVGAAVNWDDQGAESLISACDQTLSDATSHLDPSGKVVVNEVIFGLPSDWVNEDKIRTAKLALLKEMAGKLELKPVGFVVTPEAVVKYLHHTENVPPTAILLGFWPQTLEVTLVRMGKADRTELVKRSSQLADDVVEGLARFPNVEVMPSRMLLYDSTVDLEETKQLLLQHPWQAPAKKLPFLHFPKVEILPADFTVRAIALAGGTEVARAIGLLASEEVEAEAVPASAPSSEELGFVTDADIRSVTPPTAEPVSSPAPIVPRPKFHLPQLRLPAFSLPKLRMSLASVIAIIAVVLTGVGVAYWYLPKADVVVFVKPQNFQTQFDLIADTRLDAIALDKNSIPAQSLSVEVSSAQTTPTSGTKLVGDKATGAVTISNTLDSSRQLTAATGLTSPSGLKFILDEAVTVASASGSAGNLTPGKATAKATAATIGGDYNLAGGTVFRVGSFAITQIDAKNDTAFSGGTSRQAQAVAKADVDKLRSELAASLKDQAKQKLMEQITDQQTVINESIAVATVAEDFDHKVGEEADQVTLKLTVKATGMVVAKADLQAVVNAQIQPQVPSGYTSISEQNQTFLVKQAGSDQVTFSAQVSALLLPQIDQEEVIKNIRGKSPVQARQYLQSLPAAAQIDMVITPSLPAAITTLPRLAKNISLSIRPLK